MEDAYITLADPQIAAQKAANVEGFCVESLRSKVDRSKQKIVWLGCSNGGKYKAEGHGVHNTSTQLLVCPWYIIVREVWDECCRNSR